MSRPSRILVEACVDSVFSARQAAAGGAQRLELCDNLVEGGTTPSVGMIAAVRDAVRLPVFVLIRPRGGDFLYDADEVRIIRRDITEAGTHGADGVVIGALTREGRVDAGIMARLLDAARPMAVTFHRAFDLARDPGEALEMLVKLGIPRVLTSGQAPTALEGIPLLKTLVRQAGDRIEILAGGGISEENAGRIVRETGVREIHLRGSRTAPSPMAFRRDGVAMGKAHQPDEYRRVETDAARIRAIVEAVTDPGA
ncbi:MAG TPA: copper homeostasis protein CutC [Gemmatimonadales bacterium]|nr:copper homeostasis protein CutC [Gemmatimonadales bacterium]